MDGSSLSGYYEWDRVWALLGGDAKTRQLPAVVACRSCRRPRLYVYADHTHGGAWAHCRQCGQHGDMIELARQTWKLDAAAVVKRLAAHELQPDIAAEDLLPAYEARIQTQHAAEAFWETCRQNLYQRPRDPHDLQTKIGITHNLNRADWPNGGWELAGWSNAAEVNAFALAANPAELQPVLRGAGWDACLVLPFYDLPGRLTGFLFLGRGGDPIARVYYALRRRGPRGDAGFTCLPGLLAKPANGLDDALYVLSDPLWVLRLQLRWMRAGAKALPVVGGYEGPEVVAGNTWVSFAGRRRLFGGPQVGPQLLRLASRCEGSVSQYTTPPYEPDGSHIDPLYWLRSFRKQATSWRSVLGQQLSSRDPDEVVSWLAELELTQHERNRLREHCEPALQATLQQLAEQPTLSPPVLIRGRYLQESVRGWSLRNGELICNARIRIDQIIYTHNARRYYRGRVLLGEDVIPFMERVDAVRNRGLLECLEPIVSLATKAPLQFDAAWNRCADRIAMQFHNPEIVDGTDRVGWQAPQRRFRLPTFLLLSGGRVVTDHTAVFTEHRLPAIDLPLPGPVVGRELQSLCGDEFAVFWASFAAITHNIIAPAVGFEMPGTVWVGSAQTQGLQAATACGCLTEPVPHTRLPLALATLASYTQRHAWPVVLSHTPATEDNRNAWLSEPIAGQCLLAADWYAAHVATTQNWLAIEDSPVGGTLSPAQRVIAQTLLPNYLQDFCQRRMQLTSDAAASLYASLEDVAGWLERQSGQHFDVSRVQQRYTLPQDRYGPRLFALLNRLIHRGDLTETVTGTQLWIPQQRLNMLLRRHGAPPLNLFTVAGLLRSEDLLQGEEEQHQDRYWLVPLAAWRQHGKLYEQDRAQLRAM